MQCLYDVHIMFILYYVLTIDLTLTAWFFMFTSCIVAKATKKEGNLHGYSETDVLHGQTRSQHIFSL